MIMRHQHQHQHQFMSDISPNNRPAQQSSPSDNSMSTATPPQQVSRASPASTALVMSQNNINHSIQPASRQLTPNLSSSNNGTGGSSASNANSGPPNPMARQFACHTKSMSAGVVVSVPGISNNLATATGMHQNNMINNNIMTNQHHRTNAGNLPNVVPENLPMTNYHGHHSSRGHHQQPPVIREHRNHHFQQASHPSAQPANSNVSHHHHNVQQPQSQHYNTNNTHYQGQNGSSNQFLNARQATGSSIILSNANINNIHNRSASTHLSNVLLGPQSAHSQTNHRSGNTNTNYPSHVNSNWTIDENISKSHGKLTASGYLPHPYLFNPSITDVSCDNLSNPSRLVDGAPAPGYYLHAAGDLPTSHALSASGSIKSPEFLPICDLMFNLISMIIYFCENVFNVIALIALYYHASSKYWALIGAVFVLASNFICQYLSLRWLYKTKLDDCRRKRDAQEELQEEENCERRFYNSMTANLGGYQCGSCTWLPDSATEMQLKFLLSVALDAILHIFCLGFLLRYIKLVIPVTDTARVKREARDLCMLRMIHGFVQTAPLLLVQAYVICSQSSSQPIVNLSTTAAILSLINLCWGLASFTKYARKKYIHKFVLTWLGIASQFLWRLGTVSSRIVALTIYAVYYNYWMLVVLALHWVTMFLWLIKPGNLLRDEVKMPRVRKISCAMAAAWIYCFCYMNFEEHNSKIKMISYYSIMFLENNLLLTVSLIFSSQVTWFKNVSILVVYLGFVFGVLFMFIYYKYFHVNVLDSGMSRSQDSIDSIADQLSPAGKKIAGFKPGTLRLKNEDSLASAHRYSSNISATLHTGSHPEITRSIKPPYLSASQAPLSNSSVFPCRPSTGLKKQKIPSMNSRGPNS